MSKKKYPPAPSQILVDQLKDDLRNGLKSIQNVGKALRLNQRQTKFAIEYAVNNQNLTRSYAIAYGITDAGKPDEPSYNSCATEGSWLGKHPVVCALMDIIYAGAGLSQTALDKALSNIVHNGSNEVARVMAIKHAHELTGRTTKDTTTTVKIETGFNLRQLTDEQYEQLKALAAASGFKQISNGDADSEAIPS